MFRIYPAVDIKGGKCVRLYQGDMKRETVYSENPWEMALAWEKQGASRLHVVDLDGATGDSMVNLAAVRSILDRTSIPVQVGGGIRSKEDIELLLSMGAERVVLGTRALTEYGFLEDMTANFGPRVIVSIDTRDGEIAVKGWTQTVNHSSDGLIDRLLRCGSERFIHTDISRDGTLHGYDTNVLEHLLGRGLGIIAAGGITALGDLDRLKRLASRGLEGAIIGRSLYTGDLVLADILHLEE